MIATQFWTRSQCVLLLIFVGPVQRAHTQVPRHILTEAETFPEAFSRIRGFRELGDGRLLITDWLEQRLIALDFDAGTVRDIGRLGGGPREYRLPSRLIAYGADTTLLVDLGNGRLVVVGPEAEIVNTVDARGNRPFTIQPRGADPSGNLYFQAPTWWRGSGNVADSGPLMRWDPNTDDMIPIARVLVRRRRQDSGPRLTLGIPIVVFSPQDAWAVAPDGSVAIVRAHGYHVEWIGPDGEVIRGPSYSYDQFPADDAEKIAWVRRFVTNAPMSGRGENGGLGLTPSELSSPQAIREMVDTNQFEPVLPYFTGRSFVAPDGMLWVERSAPVGRASVFDLFDRRGALVRQVQLPLDRRLLGVGRDVIYAVVADDVGLEYLERYRLAE